MATLKFVRGDRVRGAVYDISDGCLRRLDRCEGYPDSCERKNVTVFDADDEAVDAFTYIRKGQIEEGKPSAAYLAVIQQGLRDWRLF